LALLRKANPYCSVGFFSKRIYRAGFDFASQSQSILLEWLCFAKSIHFTGMALLRKAFATRSDWLCFAKPILCDGLALLRKANPS
jgi:hypothetical protein